MPGFYVIPIRRISSFAGSWSCHLCQELLRERASAFGYQAWGAPAVKTCFWCCHTSTQFPSRTQRHNPHPIEWTLKYRKRYLWYSLSLMPDLLGSARTVYFPNALDEISSLLCMVAACHLQAHMHYGKGRVVVSTWRSQFCVALCFLFTLFLNEKVARYFPRNYWWVLQLGAAPVVSLHRLDWKSLYCNHSVDAWVLKRGALRVAFSSIFPSTRTAHCHWEKHWSKLFGVTFSPLNQMPWLGRSLGICFTCIWRKSMWYECTLRCLEMPTAFGISGYSGILSHCNASNTIQTHNFSLFRKFWVKNLMYATVFLFSSENWMEEKLSS